MTGDGLQDIVLLRNGNVAYWPNLGHGRLGPPVHDAARAAAARRASTRGGCCSATWTATAWPTSSTWTTAGSCSGSTRAATAGAQPIVDRRHAADVVDADAVRLADLLGTGMAGLLWSRAADGSAGHGCGSSTSPAGTSRTC